MGAWKNRRKKEPNAPTHSDGGPTKNLLHTCIEASGKMCRHNLTGYISPMYAANLSKLGRFPSHLLKYSGFQSTHGGFAANGLNLHRHRRFCKSPDAEEVRICTEWYGVVRNITDSTSH